MLPCPECVLERSRAARTATLCGLATLVLVLLACWTWPAVTPCPANPLLDLNRRVDESDNVHIREVCESTCREQHREGCYEECLENEVGVGAPDPSCGKRDELLPLVPTLCILVAAFTFAFSIAATRTVRQLRHDPQGEPYRSGSPCRLHPVRDSTEPSADSPA